MFHRLFCQIFQFCVYKRGLIEIFNSRHLRFPNRTPWIKEEGEGDLFCAKQKQRSKFSLSLTLFSQKGRPRKRPPSSSMNLWGGGGGRQVWIWREEGGEKAACERQEEKGGIPISSTSTSAEAEEENERHTNTRGIRHFLIKRFLKEKYYFLTIKHEKDNGERTKVISILCRFHISCTVFWTEIDIMPRLNCRIPLSLAIR